MNNNSLNNTTQLTAKIEGAIDKTALGGISVSSTNGLTVENMAQVMEFAKMMAISQQAVPKHLRDNPGACLAISIQAYEWSINPFALANKSYIVTDRIAYEASLYHAVVTQRAPIKGRPKSKYAGEGKARTCTITAVLNDGSDDVVEYTSPLIGNIKPQNSPLWVNDPDQQLFYYSIRAFARRHFPDVMMGIYTVDELQDSGVIPTSAARPSTTLDSLTSPKVVEPVPDPQIVDVDPVDESGSDRQAD